MTTINILDQNTIDKIAAGEVVERPASIVKELCENSIDAGADRILIEIEEGGTTNIRITDNGSGIAASEVRKAFLRHSTSKISDAEDLFSVMTLGFRGEALSSISAVADVEMITKAKEEDYGTHYRIEGGRESTLEPTGAPDGTTIYVRRLFFNTPARKKFLRTSITEAGHVQDTVLKLALSHPEVAFTFYNQGVIKLQTPGNDSLRDTIISVYGKESAKNLIEVDHHRDGIRITGLIGDPGLSRGNRKCEHYFMNNRCFRDPLVSKAIEDAYRPFLMQHKYPFTVLHLEMNPEDMDVNVHPAKLEIRFRNKSLVYKQVLDGISEALSVREMLPDVSLAPKAPVTSPVPETVPERKSEIRYKKEDVPKDSEAAKYFFFEEMRKRVNAFHAEEQAASYRDTPRAEAVKIDEIPEIPEPAKDKPAQLSFFEDKILTEEKRRDFRIIGQLFNTYWLIESEDKMLMVDQHAAHEKVLYERLIKKIQKENIPSQMIMPPMVLKLSLREQQLVKSNIHEFEKMGFELEPFEGSDYVIRGVPSMLSELSDKDLFAEMLDSLEEAAGMSTYSMSMDHRIATMACKAAVKGRQHISVKEMEALTDELLTLENPYNCPHGRPTMIVLSKSEIEKKFKRIV